MGQSWFAGSDVEKVVFSKTIRVLKSSAFMGCKRLREVVFSRGSSLEEIGESCFQGSGLERFRAPLGLKTIGLAAFADCAQLKRVSLNDGL